MTRSPMVHARPRWKGRPSSSNPSAGMGSRCASPADAQPGRRHMLGRVSTAQSSPECSPMVGCPGARGERELPNNETATHIAVRPRPGRAGGGWEGGCWVRRGVDAVGLHFAAAGHALIFACVRPIPCKTSPCNVLRACMAHASPRSAALPLSVGNCAWAILDTTAGPLGTHLCRI